jgi:hypothetical protein
VRQIFPFSSIRTLTVGFGIAPNLLTPPIARRALAGFGDRSPFTAGGDFHPAPRTRSDRNPTNAINAPLAKPCNDFRELLDHAEPTERFSTANDYYPTACDSCRGGTWVRTKLGRVLMRSHHGRSPASAQGVPCGRPVGKTVHQAPHTLHRVGKTARHREVGSTTRAEYVDREIRIRGRAAQFADCEHRPAQIDRSDADEPVRMHGRMRQPHHCLSVGCEVPTTHTSPRQTPPASIASIVAARGISSSAARFAVGNQRLSGSNIG